MSADDLVSRLSETLDEAERLALQARGHQWVDRHNPVFQGLAEAETGVPVVSGAESVLPHIVRWDPQAVLRLVEAVQTLIGAYSVAVAEERRRRDGGWIVEAQRHAIGRTQGLRAALVILAAGFGLTEEPSDG